MKYKGDKKQKRAMKTYKQLKDFCEANNVRYEVNTLYSEPVFSERLKKGDDGRLHFTKKEHRTILGFEIGMCNIEGRNGESEWQWTWFETLLFPYILEDDTEFIFRNRYDHLNNANYKGWIEEMKADSIIEARMR